jgi:hypothetical protein
MKLFFEKIIRIAIIAFVAAVATIAIRANGIPAFEQFALTWIILELTCHD